MKQLLYIVLLWLTPVAFAQGKVDGIRDFKLPGTEENLRYHSAIQPEIRYQTSFKRALIRATDTLITNSDTTISFPLWTPAFRERSSVILPAVDSYFQFDTAIGYRAAIGFNLEKTIGKWYNRTQVTTGWSTREGINQTHTAFLPLQDRNHYWYTDIRTRFGYTPNKQLHLSAGIDNQFFGEGYRSLIQGDQVAPNPFVLLRTNFWRFEYGLLYQLYHEQDSARHWKFSTSHYLSFNVTKRWNITLFETVLFQPKDGNFNRGFEVEYLNPIVFFRPQEYSLGSSDNVLLALNSSYKWKTHCVYGQFLLDEFVLSEIKKHSRWWANKYGIQVGFKGQIQKIAYQLEANIVRPYTYSHINSGQNLGNMGRPVAHPLGSNFAELLSVIRFTKWQTLFKVYGSFVLKGYDENAVSWGGDVYQSYVLKPADKEYGHTIGQGITLRTLQLGIQPAKSIEALQSELFLQFSGNYTWGDQIGQLSGSFCVGIRNNLFQNRKLF